MKVIKTCACLLLIMTFLSCSSWKNSHRGEVFYSFESDKEVVLDSELSSFLDKNMRVLTKDEALEKFHRPLKVVSSPEAEVWGWTYSVDNSRQNDYWVYKTNKGMLQEKVMSLAFDKKGILIDYELMQNNLPMSESMMTSEPAVQAAVMIASVFAVNHLLDRTLSRASNRALNSMEDRGYTFTQKIEERIAPYEAEIRGFLERDDIKMYHSEVKKILAK
jgi:hypothetical protein